MIIEKTTVYKVKGTSVPFTEKIKIDDITGEKIYDPVLEQENDLRLYNEYRKIKGLLLPHEITRIRKNKKLSILEFSLILNIHERRLLQIENGSIQTFEEDEKIRNFLKFE